MCRLLLAYPRECQTQSSSSPQFKVVTRPLEFLILIASTGPRLRWRQRTGRVKMWASAEKERSGGKLACRFPLCSSVISNRHAAPLSPESEEGTLEVLLGRGQRALLNLHLLATRWRLHRFSKRHLIEALWGK